MPSLISTQPGGAAVDTIEILTFDGCNAAANLFEELSSRSDEMRVHVFKHVITSIEEAADRGLHGSPTVVVNGEEYQENVGANPGFY